MDKRFKVGDKATDWDNRAGVVIKTRIMESPATSPHPIKRYQRVLLQRDGLATSEGASRYFTAIEP